MNQQVNSKPKILVVDDEPDNLDLLYRTFYRDYKVLKANSGPAALKLLAQEGEVSVIISDQRMPMMSGTEFLSQTATQYPDIIRIILTGYTDVEDLVEAINAGKVFKYVTKPWEAEDLKALVRQALDTHNVLKTRTRELTRTLRQESLLNTVTNTIRSALDYRQILQTIVDTVGHMLEADICLLRPFQDEQLAEEAFIYEKIAQRTATASNSTNNPTTIAAASQVNVSPLGFALLIQTVWETREVQVIYDVSSDERIQEQRAEAFIAANICSSLVVPLISQQELIAVLALHQRFETRVWGDEEVQLVLMVADQAALALSQAYAYEQVNALAKREVLVNTITSAIRSSLDPQDIFAAITQQLGQALQVNGCALSLWTEDDNYVERVGLYDSSQQQDSEEVAGLFNGNQIILVQQLLTSRALIQDNPILQELLRTQEPVVISELSQSLKEMQAIDLPGKMAVGSLMVVPLLADGKCIGSITLGEVSKTRRWLASDIQLAKSVAAQAAIAVQQSRLYQKTREQAERLIELDRQKTEFFQNISHEFRTPITLIQGPLESAVEIGEGLSLTQSVIALRNSRRLLRLVNQLLDLQRLDAGRMQPTFCPCDLVDFVSQIVESFRPYCERKGLQVVTQLLECPTVYLDMEKFDKVIYNLLSNAMKFTPDGGAIVVRLHSEGENCILQVEDTGIGIVQEQIPYLFERFRQAEGSENRSYEGSGLGLALVKELVELHGGQVSVSSIYGQGTTFNIRLLAGSDHLPKGQILEIAGELNISRSNVELADVDQLESSIETLRLDRNTIFNGETQDPQSLRQNQQSNGHLVLVVDDNPDLRGYVADILYRNGYEVDTARNGYEGYNTAQEIKPSLIVTDLMMPLVTGLEMIRMIRSDQILKGTPIILLTAKADEETRIEGTEHGADAYLAKPFNDRELVANVKNLLSLKENEKRISELNNYLTESVLKRFLPAALVQKAAAGALSLDLRPEPRLVTVLFSDIVGFTQLANTLRSRKVAEILNEYLEVMTRVVFENGGTVDKFMGDGILALYGAPEELTPNEQVRRAINTARGMQYALINLNEHWRNKGIFETDGRSSVQFRCGIHQGTAVVGMFGSAERADYTAIGPTVNIAARLQSAAVPGTILVSAAVADYLQEEEITKGSPLELKGIDETVLTFVVTAELPKETPKSKARNSFL